MPARPFAIAAVLTASLFVTAGATSAGDRDPGQRWIHPELGYSVLYPSDWSMQHGEEDEQDTEDDRRDRRNRGAASKLSQDAVNFFAPLEDEADRFPEMLSVYARELDRPMPVHVAAEIVKVFINATGAELVERKAGFRFAGSDAERLTWQVSWPNPFDADEPLELKAVQYVTVSNHYAVAVTFIFEPSVIDRYRGTFETMREGFRLK